MKKLRKGLRKNCKGENGAVSLPFVFIILILTFSFIIFVDQFKSTQDVTEVESILDLASVEALRYAVDEDKWNQGFLVIDEDLAKDKFVEILNSSIGTGSMGNITGYSIQGGKDGINITYNDDGLATGVQLSQPDENGNVINKEVKVTSCFLDAVVDLTYSVRKDTDFIGAVSTKFYNIFIKEDQEATNDNSAIDGLVTVPIQAIGKVTLK